MSTPTSALPTTNSEGAESSAPAAASSLLVMDLGKDEHSSDATASTSSRTGSEIHSDEESQDDLVPITESDSDARGISSNDDIPRRENHSRQSAQQQDLDGANPTENDNTAAVHDGSYVVSASSVAIGEKICCGVVPPRFSLALLVGFIAGMFLLLCWLTENEIIL